MGYDVHITRKGDWWEDDGPTITRAEWLAFVASDPSMRPEREAKVENGRGEAFLVREETLAVWTDWEHRAEGRNEAWMWLSNGNVVAKNPDEAMLRKMFLIADRLGAKVQGDEGELYDALGHGGKAREMAESRRWWRVHWPF